ncbi:MAG TPA: hypothetical protein VMP08_14000 [Anaerolineae bacterium]|nr:hypothetical protein [Anaerolineae bacterium]
MAARRITDGRIVLPDAIVTDRVLVIESGKIVAWADPRRLPRLDLAHNIARASLS